MRASFVSCLVTVGLVSVACGYRPPTYYPGPNASETMVVRVAQDQVERVANELRQGMASGNQHGSGSISISTTPDYTGPPQTIEAETDIYVLALDDAHRKAEAIAAREHVGLGPVLSIQEVLSGAGPPTLLKGNTPPTHGIRVSSNQPVTLYVTFRLGSPTQQSDVPQVIAVYGLASPEIKPRWGTQGPPKVIEISIGANARRPEAAIDALMQYDRLVRDALAKIGVPASAVTVSRSSTYQQ